MKRIAYGLLIAAAAGLTLQAQNNWTQVGQDSGHTKYSTLDQINTTNVAKLQRAWSFHTGDKSGFFESTPLVVGDTLYVSAQNGVYALEPTTGMQKWKFEASGTARRGMTYWPGEAGAPPVLFVPSQTKLLALNPADGKLVQSFGQGGFIEMGSPAQSAVAIYKDVLIAPQVQPVIRAWNAKTGAPLWTFNLVAQPGDPNHKTWESDVWKTIGGTNTWGYLSVDADRGIVYIPVSIAGNDYVGVERPGDNLYGTSLVAVDIKTGKRLWHQQLVHHDIWDYDLGAAPTLFDVTKDGKTVPGVAQITKMGIMFIFNRVTGEPLFGMEERAVPQSSVPGEKSSPTQPFPLKPPPLARMSLKRSELPKNITPELAAYCEGIWDKYKLQDAVPYTPWKVGQDVVTFPGAIGGGNWQGIAFNKKLGLLITNVMNAGQWGHLEEVKPGEGGGFGGRGGRGGPPGGGLPGGGPPGGAPPAGAQRPPRPPAEDDGASASRSPFRKITPEGGRFWQAETRYSCNPPPWGELVAVNASTGDIAWRIPLGIFDELEAKGIKTGTPMTGGGITTAGDLVFIGATVDAYFRAIDARNGKELWSSKLEVPAHSVPSTYLGHDGKQYVVVTVGGGGFLRTPTSDTVAAFRLP
jgi:quinoprotein glucose dehydrogenase